MKPLAFRFFDTRKPSFLGSIVILSFMLCSHTCWAGRVDELFRNSPSLSQIMEVLNSKGKFSIQELVEIEERSLKQFPSAAEYEIILGAGLHQDDPEFQLNTLKLLKRTVDDYLGKGPEL